jgi:sugar lactone lactonase YvrE
VEQLMTRRDALRALGLLVTSARIDAAPAVSTVIGTGSPGYSDREVNSPYGLVVAGEALYFCDLDNQRIRRFDLKTHMATTIAGNGARGYSGDGGPATAASLNMPHEIQFDASGNLYIVERDNHVVRRVDTGNGTITTLAGTGAAGFSGDGGPAARAQLRSPHSIAFAPDGDLLICDIGNHRIRRVRLRTGTIDTWAGTGARDRTPDGSPLIGTPLNGPRTLALADHGDFYLALREGNALYRIAARTATIHHVAGTGVSGYSGDNGPAREAALAGPKGLAYGRGQLYVADTENHVIRRIDLDGGTIRTVLGDGQRGDGPEADPLRCRLSRPHGVFAGADGALYVGDSEAHRIRVLRDR